MDELTKWLMCGGCGTVLKQSGLELLEIDRPAPCCHAKGFRSIWPEKGHGPLELVHRLDVSSEEGSRTAAVFLCAALEAVLSKSLWFILTRLATPGPVALAVMDRCDTRDPMMKLWGKLVGISAQEAMQSVRLGKWFADWTKLAKARNQLAHGEWEVVEASDSLPALVARVRDGALVSMAAMHNYVVADFNKKNHPPQHVDGFIVDLGTNTPVLLGSADEATWPPYRVHDWGDGHPQAQTYHPYAVERDGKHAVLYIHDAERPDAQGGTRVDAVLRRLHGFSRRQPTP